MPVSTAKRLKAAANRISARSRIAIGLVFLLVAVLWMAIALGLVPSERSAIIAGRCQNVRSHRHCRIGIRRTRRL